PYIDQFSYSPDTNRSGIAELNHHQVIEITATLLSDTALLPKLLVQHFPIILIDECQDTNKQLMNSLLRVERESGLCLGLFGDMMQRIFYGGKEDLLDTIKEYEWKQPTKR